MKQRLLLLFAAICFTSVSILAESDEHKQILVFRKSGITNIFYSDKVARIELTKFDADSVEHDELVSQAFVRSDGSAVIVPIADIDSVAFGSRNTIKTKASVRRLSDEEADAIGEFDEAQLKYKSGTDASLIVRTGEKVYYDRITDVLPYGICAYVKNVATENGVVVAAIDYLPPEEMFDKFFLSGDGTEIQSRSLAGEADMEYKHFEIKLPEIDYDNITASGHINLTSGIRAEEVVFDPWNHYYHALITVCISPEIKAVFESKDNIKKEIVSSPMPVRFRLPTAMGAIALDIELGGFLDFMVEAGIDYEYKTEYKAVFEWERKDGQNTFREPVFTQNPLGDMEQKVQCYLNGKLYLGALADIGIGVLFDRLGAGAMIKLGPELNGEFGMEAINRLTTEYSQETYGKAKITLSAKLAMETYTYRLTNWIFGKQDRSKLPFEAELPYEIGTLDLFPEFHTRSTAGREHGSFVQTPGLSKAIDVAAYSENPVESPIEIGFEIADSQTDETIKSLWDQENSDILQPKNAEAQSFNTEFPLRDELKGIDPENVVVRPIFKYRDHIIKAAPATPLSGMFLSPVIYQGSRSARYIVSGQSVVSQSTVDETTFHQGNILPVVEKDNKYKGKRTANTIEFIEIDIPGSAGVPRHSLLGTWCGSVTGENVIMTFSDESTGTYNGTPFTYKVNSPQKGGISIKMENGSTITFLVLELNSSSMKIAPRFSKKQFVLTKQ